MGPFASAAMPSDTRVQFRVLTLSGVILLGLPMRQAQQVGGGNGKRKPELLGDVREVAVS